MSFSRDGRYLAYGGSDKKVTPWVVKDIAPELPSSSSFLEVSALIPRCRLCLLTGSSQVDATNHFAQPRGDDIEGGHDNPYGNFFQRLEPSHPSQFRNLLSPRRWWNVFIPSRHDPLADKSIPLQPRIKRGLFSRHTGPQPITVAAGRPRRFYWTVPRSWRPVIPENESVEEENGNANAHAGQSSSTAAQPPLHEDQNLAGESGNVNAQTSQFSSSLARPSFGLVPYSIPQGPRHATQRTEEEFDFGCWGNLLHAVCCISGRPRGTVSVVHPAAT